MDMNSYLLEFELRQRRREMLAEAKRQHLVKLYGAGYQGKIDQLFLALANFLIGLGEQLKRRHTAPAALEGDFCRE